MSDNDVTTAMVIPTAQVVIDTIGMCIALLSLYQLRPKAEKTLRSAAPKGRGILENDRLVMLADLTAKLTLIAWSVLGYYETKTSQNKATAALSNVYIGLETFVTIAVCNHFQMFRSGPGLWGVIVTSTVMFILLIAQIAAICLPWPRYAGIVRTMNGLSGLICLVTTVILSYVMTSLLLELQSRLTAQAERKKKQQPQNKSTSTDLYDPNQKQSDFWKALISRGKVEGGEFGSAQQVQIQRFKLQVYLVVISVFCGSVAILYVTGILSRLSLGSLIWIAVPLFLILLSKVRDLGLSILDQQVDPEPEAATFAPVGAITNKMSIAVLGNTMQTGILASRMDAADQGSVQPQPAQRPQPLLQTTRPQVAQKSILKRSSPSIGTALKSAEIPKSSSAFKMKVDWKDLLEIELRSPRSKSKLHGFSSTDDVSLARPKGNKLHTKLNQEAVSHRVSSLPAELNDIHLDPANFETIPRASYSSDSRSQFATAKRGDSDELHQSDRDTSVM